MSFYKKQLEKIVAQRTNAAKVSAERAREQPKDTEDSSMGIMRPRQRPTKAMTTEGDPEQVATLRDSVLQSAIDTVRSGIRKINSSNSVESGYSKSGYAVSKSPRPSKRPESWNPEIKQPGLGDRPRARPGQAITQGLMDRGMPEHIAMGFTRNMLDESRLDPDAKEKNPLIKGSRGGFGLYQLTGPRRKAYEAYATKRGVELGDIDTQLDFLMHELNTTEKPARDKIYGTETSGQAASAIVNSFLRPAEKYRKKRSQKYLSE